MRIYRIVIASFGIGGVLTALTALIDQTPSNLVGARWYGFPLTWLRRLIVAPQYNPWQVDYTGLIIDISVWFLVAFVVLYLITGRPKGSK